MKAIIVIEFDPDKMISSYAGVDEKVNNFSTHLEDVLKKELPQSTELFLVEEVLLPDNEIFATPEEQKDFFPKANAIRNFCLKALGYG